MPDVAGTPKKVTLAGITFDVMADTDISEVQSKILNEPLETSGRTMRKMTSRNTMRESVVIACNASEGAILKGFADNSEDITMSYTTAAGDVYRSTGFIEYENRTTAENRATIKMHPTLDWTLFAA